MNGKLSLSDIICRTSESLTAFSIASYIAATVYVDNKALHQDAGDAVNHTDFLVPLTSIAAGTTNRTRRKG